MVDWKKNKLNRGKSKYKGLGKGEVGGIGEVVKFAWPLKKIVLVAGVREGKGKWKESPLEIR